MPEHDVVNGIPVERPLLQAAQRYLAEFRGAERLQGAAVPAECGTGSQITTSRMMRNHARRAGVTGLIFS